MPLHDPKPEELQPTPEHDGRAIEIRHHGQFDIMINRQVVKPEKAGELAKLLKNGIPETWVKVRPDKEWFTDSVDAPRFFVKGKYHYPSAEIRQTRELKATAPQVFEATDRVARSFNSLSNEIFLTRKVNEILASAEVKDLAVLFGFDEIRLVEPLVGVIDRSTSRKFVGYEYVQGSAHFEREGYGKLDRLVERLWKVFQEHGIDAREIHSSQLIEGEEDGKPIAYLTDIEGYLEND